MIRSGYLELVDSNDSMYRWTFPMSRLDATEYTNVGTLMDYMDSKIVTTCLCLPEKVLSPTKDSSDISICVTRRDTEQRHGIVVPPYSVVNRSFERKKPEFEVEDDMVKPITFIGPYPSHLSDSDFSSYVNWNWTSPSTCV